MTKKYLYENAVENQSRTGSFELRLNFFDSKFLASVKENFFLYKTLGAVVLSGISLAAIFLFNWIFVVVLVPSLILAVSNFAEDYTLLKAKEDFEENGIF